MSVKVSISFPISRTNVSVRKYKLGNMRESHFLNERINIPLSSLRRKNNTEKEIESDTFHINTNNYRKIMDTFFEPYD